MLTGALDVSAAIYDLMIASANKIITASPSGNFLIFDINKGKLGMRRPSLLRGATLISCRKGG
jgi:hypothetical protein